MSCFRKFSWPFRSCAQAQAESGAQQETGSRGENIAASFLEGQGYTIMARNYRRRFGEIDIVAEERGVLVFVEVKARKNNRYGNPFEAVDTRKQKKLSRMAQDYINRYRMEDRPARFDVVAVRLHQDSPPEIELIRDAFDFQE